MKRIFYALGKAWAYRRALGTAFGHPDCRITSVTILTASELKSRGIQHLVLDFDGVLAAHAETAMRVEVVQWLHHLLQHWPIERVSLWTNKPAPKRLEWLEEHFPGLEILQGFAKKPYPEALADGLSRWGVPPESVVMVDDRWWTGLLAAEQCGVKLLYLSHPFRCIWRRPLREMGFSFLRGVERVMVPLLKRL